MKAIGFPATMMLTLLVLARIMPEAFSEAYTNLLMGYLCVRSDFILTVQGSLTDIECAVLCERNQRCQAFTMADGPCQLFVFDKCSKSVRDCSCSRRGQVFVKQQPGLEAGQLCPTGYGDDLCGVKYKLLAGTDYWWPSKQKCESESGLVIMADVINATELSHIGTLYSLVPSIWLGGLQAPGSPEPAGGWYWVGCNITMDGSLWGTNEPGNESPYGENVVVRYPAGSNLVDLWQSANVFRVVCECVSPFD